MATQLSAVEPAPLTAADYLARVDRVAPVILENAERIEQERRLPPEVLSALHEESLFRLLLPRAYQGEEVNPQTFFQVMAALSALDASTAWCIGQGNGCAMTAAYLDPPVAREIWGDDPQGVLAWGPVKAEIVQDDKGFHVNGKWSFASGSRHATWLGGHSLLQQADGSTVPRTMLFPADAVEMIDIWDVIGLRGTASDAYTVTDTFVPYEYTVSRDDPAARQYHAPLYHFLATNLYAIGFSGVALGIARAMLDAFKELASDKTPRRARESLRENHVIQTEVAVSEAKLKSARAFMLSELEEIWDDVVAHDRLPIESRMRIRLASTYIIHEARDVANTVYDSAGASAIFRSSPFERRYRDLHTVAQQIQGRKDHFQTVGGFMLGLPPDTSGL